jgi:GTPase
MSFTLAIVGRPNVGKSTLFNRLAGKRLALVDDTPGVTRDRREGIGHIGDLSFRMFDTAGLEEGDEGSLWARMRVQTESGLADADIALMMVDARAGITPLDKHFADWIRKKKIHVILVANKCEGTKADAGFYDSFSLGLGDPHELSAEHGDGLAGLYTSILEITQKEGWDDGGQKKANAQERRQENLDDIEDNLEYEFEDNEQEQSKPLQLAVIGRPNAGKSTLINYLIGEDRLITGPEPGLTRDSISVDWDYEGRAIRLFDTAGLRKKANVVEKLEKLSVADAMRAIQYAQVVVLLIDAELGVQKQDLKIASLVVQEGRALVVALNKWDLVEDRLAVQRAAGDVLARSLPQLKGVQLIQFSALSGQGTKKMLPAVMKSYEYWNSRVATSPLNKWLIDTLDRHPPPLVGGRRIKIRFIAQIKTRPPTFTLFVNRPTDVPDSYLRYLENDIRNAFDLPGVPLRFLMRKGKNPYEGRKKKRGR